MFEDKSLKNIDQIVKLRLFGIDRDAISWYTVSKC